MVEQLSYQESNLKIISEATAPKPAPVGRSLFLQAVLFSFCFFSCAQPAEAVTQYNQTDIIQKYGLESCNDKVLSIEFLCNPDWEYHISEGALMVVISSQPLVTATFAKIDSSVSFLTQLNKEELVKKNLYRTGFKQELTKTNGQDSVVVRAFSRSEPQRRVLDYFFIHEGGLFGALFAVSPIDDWDDYKFLIKTMADSIMLIKRDQKNAV